MGRPVGSVSHALTERRPAGRPKGWRKQAPPTTVERMIDALCIRNVDLDDADGAAAVLRLSGFRLMCVARHLDEVVAAARIRRTGRR